MTAAALPKSPRGLSWQALSWRSLRWTSRAEAKKARERLVIVGNGMVGQRLCERLVELGASQHFEISVLAEEPRPAYDRIHLADVLCGRPADELSFRHAAWYREQGIELTLADGVDQIDLARSRVTTRAGREVPFDRLVLATGSRAIVPALPSEGVELIAYRTLEDAERLLSSVRQSQANQLPVAIVGGGLLGVEAARTFQRLGARAIVFESASQLLPRQLDPEASATLLGVLHEAGIDVRLRRKISGVRRQGSAQVIELEGGESCEVGAVVVATGAVAADALARGAGLRCHPRGGVQVNARLLTSHPRVYAIGECASHVAVPHGLVAPGYAMADLLAARLMGGRGKLGPQAAVTRLKLDLTEVTVLGDPVRAERDHEASFRGAHVYRRVLVRRGRAIAAVAVGPWEELPALQELVARGGKIEAKSLNRLKKDGVLGLTRASEVAAWPDTAVVCQCASVSCGTLRRHLQLAPCSVDELSRATRAGTFCGSCRPLLAQLAGAPLPAAAQKSRLFPAAVVAAGLVALTLLAPRVPLASSVRDSGLDALFTQTTLKQLSGFAIVAFVLLGLSFSLNKRWSLLRWFSYGTLRTWHGLLGALSLLGLFVHTGFRLGANLNLVLMCLFLVSSLSGALTGFVTGTSSNGAALASALRWCHQITFWPLPVLILFHALASYYF